MNVLFWTEGFWPRIGGIEVQSAYFIEAMQKAGHQYAVMAQKDKSTWPSEEHYKSIPIKRFEYNTFFLKNKLSELCVVENHLDEIFDFFKPELIHLNTYLDACAFTYLLFKRKFKVPTILTVHALLTQEEKIYPLSKMIFESVNKICCVSQSVFQEIQYYMPEFIEKTICIYNGLPIPIITPSLLQFDPPIILCVGRLAEDKQFNLAIQACAKLKSNIPQLQLIIAGDGPELIPLNDLVKELKMESSVNFTGYVAPDDIPALINKATIVAMPSRIESFGLVAVQAGQMQRPIVASNVGGLPEVVVHQETGILVPPKDVDALALAIKSLIDNPKVAIKLGQQARERVIKKFNIQNVVTAYENEYEILLRGQ